jgi:hypothetical protein
MAGDPIDDLLSVGVFAGRPPPELFVPAVDACLGVLRERFPRYAAFLAERGVTGPVRMPEQVDALPALFLPVLKAYAFPLPPDVPVARRLTSSGTTGVPVVVPLDEASWRRRQAALLASYRGAGVLGQAGQPLDALGFLLDPATTQMAGSVVIDAALRSTPEIRSIQYLARQGTAGPSFPLETALPAIRSVAAGGPVLLIGYPALMAAAMQALAEHGLRSLPLAPGSRILTGGGWKSFLPGVRLDQDEFRRKAGAFFQVPPDAIRDMFGLSECPAVFVQCGRGSYHAPAFADARVIDPESGQAVPDGDVGLLQLTVPLTTSYPLLKILTTDKATLTTGCPCGLAAPVLTPRGRTTAARFETCAMKVGAAVA